MQHIQRLIDLFFKLLELLVVLSLFAMVVMVFGNVIMRYVFNSGIPISEELSRYAFIWLTYLGAMIAMREGGHLGVDTLIKKLPLAGKKFCVLLSESLMLFCNVLFLWGTYQMHGLQVTNVSPVAGLSMIWIYGIGYVVAFVMGVFNISKLYRLLTGQLTEAEMVQVVEAEGLKEAEATIEKAHIAGSKA
ncbi:MAG TPA: TRAP transporter small permease [Casimicrobium sp.]|nr:TRAP transporter small permease [Casimicrobium sp.]